MRCRRLLVVFLMALLPLSGCSCSSSSGGGSDFNLEEFRAAQAEREAKEKAEEEAFAKAREERKRKKEAEQQAKRKNEAEEEAQEEARPAKSNPRVGAESKARPQTKVEVSLKTIEPSELEAVIQEHRGKVVLVDFWATWCQPCLSQMPAIVDLQYTYGEQGLVVVTVSLDEPAEEAKVLKTLQQHQAGLVNLHSQQDGDLQAYQQYGITGGILPHYQLYDRQGALAQKIVAQNSRLLTNLHEQVEVAVRALLADAKKVNDDD